MPTYDETDIELLTLKDAHDAIRKHAYMYARSPREPIAEIIKGITEGIESLGITEFCVKDTDKFICVEAKDDWLQPNEVFDSVEMAFKHLAPLKGHINSVRTEVYLKAFYFDFFTSGLSGLYGNGEIARQFYLENYSNYSETGGRVLIVSKKRNLPKKHQICFTAPDAQ